MQAKLSSALHSSTRVIVLVGIAHSVSHFFQLLLPPLFPLMKAEFGVSYAALGAVSALFFTVSGIAQTAAGFLVDRLGARTLMLAGLAMLTLAGFMAAGAGGLPLLYAAAVVGGLGNSVFHPADLALLNAKVEPQRLGYAFSIHGVGGSLGWALAPVAMTALAEIYDWRTALAVAATLGLVATIFLSTQRALSMPRAPHPEAQAGQRSLRLLLAKPVLMAFVFFVLYSIAAMGMQAFGTAAAMQGFGVSLVMASGVLTAYLLANAAGVLSGGVIAARVRNHHAAAMCLLAFGAIFASLLSWRVGGTAALLPWMMLLGFSFGCVTPSRDMLVRSIAPAHARGRVYGFVYSGFDVGGLMGPLIFGWALDGGHAPWVYGGAAFFIVLSLPALMASRLERGSPAAAAVAPS